MGAKLTNTVTGEEKALINGTFISGSTNTIGNGQMKEWDVLNKSDVIDYSIKTKRRWYTIGLTKKYDMKMVIRDYETHIKQYETGASHAIGIGFNGVETGRIDINQNGGAGECSDRRDDFQCRRRDCHQRECHYIDIERLPADESAGSQSRQRCGQ